MATIEMNDHYTTTEAAELLGLSMDSVRKYLNNALSKDPNIRPKLKGISFGRSWLIHKDEVARYEKERQYAGRPAKAE